MIKDTGMLVSYVMGTMHSNSLDLASRNLRVAACQLCQILASWFFTMRVLSLNPQISLENSKLA